MDMQVNMNEVAEEYRLSHWAEIIRAREASGLTIKDYCLNEGVNVSKYFYWLKKLRRAACTELGLMPAKQTVTPAPVFAEVKLPLQHTSPYGNIFDTSISIDIAGLRFTAGSDYPISKLVEVIQVVSKTCC